MSMPTAVELIMGYKYNPYEPVYTRLPDAIADGSTSKYDHTRGRYWGSSKGYSALHGVLGGSIHREIGKERQRVGEELEDHTDLQEYISDSKVLPSRVVRTSRLRRDVHEYEKYTPNPDYVYRK